MAANSTISRLFMEQRFTTSVARAFSHARQPVPVLSTLRALMELGTLRAFMKQTLYQWGITALSHAGLLVPVSGTLRALLQLRDQIHALSHLRHPLFNEMRW